MTLLSLELENFRNFAGMDLALEPGGGILEAPNGRGKTNFLEAIHYLSLFRSFRGAPDAELAAFGERSFVVRGVAKEGDRRWGVGVAVDGARKRLSVDGRPARPADALGTALSVVLCPTDIRLVQGSPGRRRRYLDVILALSSRRYLRLLQEYRRVLAQRNRLLVTGKGTVPGALLDPWTEQLVEHGAEILATRRRFLARWGGRFAEISARLAGSSTSALAWRYVSSLTMTPAMEPAGAAPARPGFALRQERDPEAVAGRAVALEDAPGETDPGDSGDPVLDTGDPSDPVEADLEASDLRRSLGCELERLAHVERRRGATLAGPHRDDLAFHTVGSGGAERDLRRFGSQGEQRTAALALRLLESEVLTLERGQLPVVLLDDVFSELDPSRSGRLLGFLSPGQQVFLTTPKPLAVELPVELPRYTVAEGVVKAA